MKISSVVDDHWVSSALVAAETQASPKEEAADVKMAWGCPARTIALRAQVPTARLLALQTRQQLLADLVRIAESSDAYSRTRVTLVAALAGRAANFSPFTEPFEAALAS
jgi:hypothetical protein